MDKIDFVITWVDGNDIEWRKEKAKYSHDDIVDINDCRYRTMGILKYWFRAVEKYAPWVNRVHFVTWGHLPAWLNLDCAKLNVVNHTDYIPEKYLPTFSSHPIELNFHRIPNLSEKFVYFNDDMLINDYISAEFFFKKNLPCDFAHIDSVGIDLQKGDDTYGHIQINEANLVSKNFSYIKSFFSHPLKYVNFKYPLKNNIKNILKLENCRAFQGIGNHHLASAYLKKSFSNEWDVNFEILDRVCSHKFRSPYDVSQSIFRYRQIAKGEFTPVSKESRGKCYAMKMNNNDLIDEIINGYHKVICINDMVSDVDFEKSKQEIIGAYEKKLPDKSMFEK